jgi:SAM-dependent methyltransferase
MKVGGTLSKTLETVPSESWTTGSRVMDRLAWLREKRRLAGERYDTLFAPTYDEQWGHINATYRRMLSRFLDLCPPGCTVLDAACGTGKYWPLILASGRAVRGFDQSAEMLRRAHARFPDVPTEKMGLQDLHETATVEGMICMDAMEFVPPEDWPAVCCNFHRALTPDGHLYFTVEIAPEDEIRAAFRAGQEMGLPVVHGEWAHEGGYHYYPPLDQVRRWLDETHCALVDEAVGDGYHHCIVAKA